MLCFCVIILIREYIQGNKVNVPFLSILLTIESDNGDGCVLVQPRGDDDIGIRARVRVQKSKVQRCTLYDHFLSLYTSI